MAEWKWIEAKFLPAWKDKMLAGIKIATCRYRMLGQVGDRFKQYGAVFEFTQIDQVLLSTVRDHWYQEEGCLSPEEFVEIWKKIYRRWDPLKQVYLHHFRRVN